MKWNLTIFRTCMVGCLYYYIIYYRVNNMDGVYIHNNYYDVILGRNRFLVSFMKGMCV